MYAFHLLLSLIYSVVCKNMKLYHLKDNSEASTQAEHQNASDIWTPSDLLDKIGHICLHTIYSWFSHFAKMMKDSMSFCSLMASCLVKTFHLFWVFLYHSLSHRKSLFVSHDSFCLSSFRREPSPTSSLRTTWKRWSSASPPSFVSPSSPKIPR